MAAVGSGRPRPLPLETSIVYGPITSRRLGRSLGVNLLPARYKMCAFDCIYCHYGATDVKTIEPDTVTAHETDFPTVSSVVRVVETALRAHDGIDSITFSGNGEPTLHPYFAEMAFEVRRLRDRHCPDAKITLFSSAATLTRSEIRTCLHHIDMPIMKLDAGDARVFAQINRPCRAVSFDAIVDALKQVPDLTIQTVFVDGPVTNATGDAFEAWLRALAEIRPAQVQMCSTDYPVPDATVQRVPAFRLRELAAVTGERAGVPVRAY